MVSFKEETNVTSYYKQNHFPGSKSWTGYTTPASQNYTTNWDKGFVAVIAKKQTTLFSLSIP